METLPFTGSDHEPNTEAHSDVFKNRKWRLETGFTRPQVYRDIMQLTRRTGIWDKGIEQLWEDSIAIKLDAPLPESAIDAIKNSLIAGFDEAAILNALRCTIGDYWEMTKGTPHHRMLRIVRFHITRSCIPELAKDDLYAKAWVTIAMNDKIPVVIRRFGLTPSSHHQLVAMIAKRVADPILEKADGSEIDLVGFFEQFSNGASSRRETIKLLYALSEEFRGLNYDELAQMLQLEKAVLKNPTGPSVSQEVSIPATPKKSASRNVFASGGAEIPKEYCEDGKPCGPLEGNKTTVSRAISKNPNGRPDDLNRHHKSRVFVRQITPQKLEVYFRSFREFHLATDVLKEQSAERNCG